MNIKVTTTKVEIDNESLNKGEYNIRECNFDLAEEFTGLVCKALFTVSKTKLTYEQSIVSGKCDIPYEATEYRGKVEVGVIAYEVEDEELVKRYSPEPDEFFVLDGSYIEDIENQSTPTPSELEQLEARVSQVEIDAAQVEINTQDISDIKLEQITQNGDISNLQTNKADKTEIPDVSNFITKDVNDLTYYTLTTNTGSKIDLEINSSNYQLVAKLYDKNNTLISTSTTIDLPIESMVVSATYDSTNKKIVLTLQNGQTLDVPVGDLVEGLVSFTDYATTNKGGVIKIGNALGLSDTGVTSASTRTYQAYQEAGNNTFIGKGTLENVITGKGLVSDTDYATDTKGGTVKANVNGFVLGSTGNPYANTYTYAQYRDTLNNNYFIGKGTLENVLAEKIGTIETILETLDVGGGVE